MIRTFRQVKEKLTAGTEQDADDKRRIKEVEEAALSVLRHLEAYCGRFAAFNASAVDLHGELANLYPANERLSLSVAQLSASGQTFRDAISSASEMRALLERPLQQIIARTRDLTAKADERMLVRAEISHYREKVTKLANDGLTDSKKQSKAESNQEKLFKNQRQFQELDHEINTALQTLNTEIAEATNAYLASFLNLQVQYAGSLQLTYANAVAAIPGASPATGASSGAAAVPEPEDASPTVGVATLSLNDFAGPASSNADPQTSDEPTAPPSLPPRSTNPFGDESFAAPPSEPAPAAPPAPTPGNPFAF